MSEQNNADLPPSSIDIIKLAEEINNKKIDEKIEKEIKALLNANILGLLKINPAEEKIRGYILQLMKIHVPNSVPNTEKDIMDFIKNNLREKFKSRITTKPMVLDNYQYTTAVVANDEFVMIRKLKGVRQYQPSLCLSNKEMLNLYVEAEGNESMFNAKLKEALLLKYKELPLSAKKYAITAEHVDILDEQIESEKNTSFSISNIVSFMNAFYINNPQLVR